MSDTTKFSTPYTIKYNKSVPVCLNPKRSNSPEVIKIYEVTDRKQDQQI